MDKKYFLATEDQKKQIPYGDYCYNVINYDRETATLKTKPCPFLYLNDYDFWDCKLIAGENGKEELDLLLHDQCKACGVNLPEEEED